MTTDVERGTGSEGAANQTWPICVMRQARAQNVRMHVRNAHERSAVQMICAFNFIQSIINCLIQTKLE